MSGEIPSWRYFGRARKRYNDCARCGDYIEIGEYYHREVTSCGNSLYVERRHSDCPSDREFEAWVRKEEEKENKEDESKLEISLAA